MASSDKNLPYSGTLIFLDALGAKEWWRKDPAGAITKWESFIGEILKLLDTEVNKNVSLIEKFPIEEVKPLSFADTLILAIPEMFPYKPSRVSLQQIQEFLLKLMINALDREIYFRGCISFGKFYIGKNIIIGPALTEAAKYYHLPQWIGISAAPSLHYILDEKYDINQFYSHADAFVQYDIPLKNGLERDGWALAWPRLDAKERGRVDERKMQLRDLQKDVSDLNVSLKYHNTLQFYEKVVKQNAASPP